MARYKDAITLQVDVLYFGFYVLGDLREALCNLNCTRVTMEMCRTSRSHDGGYVSGGYVEMVFGYDKSVVGSNFPIMTF